jgi:hypothetical protein
MEIVCWVLAGQGWRSYLRSRATPRSYEGMAEVQPSFIMKLYHLMAIFLALFYLMMCGLNCL